LAHQSRLAPWTVLVRQDQSLDLDRQYPKRTLASAENIYSHLLQMAVMDITANLNIFIICPNFQIM
jgi:hypothetical protein